MIKLWNICGLWRDKVSGSAVYVHLNYNFEFSLIFICMLLADGSDGLGYALIILDPGMGINPCAFMVSAAAVLLLLNGVKESKCITNLFTTLNVTLLLFMAGTALVLAKAENLSPLIPPQFGVSGVIRGATSSFFGYIGFDEICCIAGEAVDPAKNMPRAIILTLIVVTSLYITASIGLVGMVPFEEISETSGFPNGFRYRGVEWAAQVAAVSTVIIPAFHIDFVQAAHLKSLYNLLCRSENW